MRRLTISIPENLYQRLRLRALEKNESLSQVINELVILGDQVCDERPIHVSAIEQHCQQLIMQMNVLIKNLAAEILKFESSDFATLMSKVVKRHQDLLSSS